MSAPQHNQGMEPNPEVRWSARSARTSLPWWGWALVAAVGGALLVGWRIEDAAVARLLPPPAAGFDSGQIQTVQLSAAEPRTVYWNFTNVVRGVRATAECRAVDRESGSEVPLELVGGDLRVNNWKALATIQPARTGGVDVACVARGAGRARFVVGGEVPSPRLLNGVSDDSGKAGGLMLTGLCFLIPALVVFAFLPVKPVVRAWVFRFWAPLLIAAVLVFTISSVWNGLLFWVLWFGIGGYLRHRANSRASSGADEDIATTEAGGR